MAASLGFPFTFSQRMELERQVRIYKYMMSSVPVPHDFLIPIAGSPSVPVASHSALGGGALNLRLAGAAEPGRCKRTDGKKWRCSRYVALDHHKYCERHLHRSRPRSRRLVEFPNKRARYTLGQALPSSSFHQNKTAWFLDKPSEKPATFWPFTSVSSYKELISLADQQWYQLMQIKAATEGFPVQNYNKQPLDLISCPNFNSCPWFLNSEIVPLEKPAARGFIDAWSTVVSTSAEASVSCNGELSVSSLHLTKGINTMTDDEMGVSECGENREYASKPHLSSWLAPASTPGGPLAEVLRPSSSKSSSHH
ncbi:hypothetical protein V6N13_046790 [Hibiscus sabdariffa]